MGAREIFDLNPYFVSFRDELSDPIAELRTDSPMELPLRHLGNTAINRITRNKLAQSITDNVSGVIGILSSARITRGQGDIVATEFYVPLDYGDDMFVSDICNPDEAGPSVNITYQRDVSSACPGSARHQLYFYSALPVLSPPTAFTYSLKADEDGRILVPVKHRGTQIGPTGYTPVDQVRLNDSLVNLHRFTKRLNEALLHKLLSDTICTEYRIPGEEYDRMPVRGYEEQTGADTV